MHPTGVRQRIELWSALLLAAATVATAYSAYQATRWGGVQATSYVQAGAIRTESAKARSDAFSFVTIDANLFTQYAVAFSEGNTRLERLLRTRFFRKEFQPAFRAWVKQHPLKNPKAAKNPFLLPQYKLARLDESEQLEKKATASFNKGKDANQTSDNYVLATIFFAAVLFFAGLSSKFTSDRVAIGTLAFGTLVFLGGLTRLATLPFY
jgi:hypothetical protein